MKKSGNRQTPLKKEILETFKRKNAEISKKILDLGHTRLDTERAKRCGHEEVIFGEGKTPEQVLEIMRALEARGGGALATRLSPEALGLVSENIKGVEIFERARIALVRPKKTPSKKRAVSKNFIAIVSAGTADYPVVEEAKICAEFFGSKVKLFNDCGVAGIHRLLACIEEIRKAKVCIAVAGMEGALPSVLAGLVSSPVIALPTSVGYGASFGGLSALLTMLNSCANGVSVVNIDNGFGAAYCANLINKI